MKRCVLLQLRRKGLNWCVKCRPSVCLSKRQSSNHCRMLIGSSVHLLFVLLKHGLMNNILQPFRWGMDSSKALSPPRSHLLQRSKSIGSPISHSVAGEARSSVL